MLKIDQGRYEDGIPVNGSRGFIRSTDYWKPQWWGFYQIKLKSLASKLASTPVSLPRSKITHCHIGQRGLTKVFNDEPRRCSPVSHELYPMSALPPSSNEWVFYSLPRNQVRAERHICRPLQCFTADRRLYPLSIHFPASILSVPVAQASLLSKIKIITPYANTPNRLLDPLFKLWGEALSKKLRRNHRPYINKLFLASSLG